MAGRGRQSWQLWLSRAVLGLLLVGSAVTVAVWRSSGTPPARAENLQDSSVWLLSAKASDGVLVDGASAAVIRRVVLQPRPVAVVQSGPDALAALGDGSLQRIDGATFDKGAPVSFGGAEAAGSAAGVLADGRARLEVHATPALDFVRDRLTGVVSVVDPATLQTVRTYSLSAPADTPEGAAISDASATADGDARLWAVDGTGTLIRIDGADSRTWPDTVTDPRLARLVDAGGQPYLVDFAAATVRALEAGGVAGESGCVQRQADLRTVRITGATQAAALYLVNGQTGVLVVSDLVTGRCGEALAVAAPGHTLGQPREAAGRVFIPDLTTGEIIVVDTTDPARPQLVARPKVLDEPSTALELVSQGPVMFYNDPAGDTAGVIRGDGSRSEIHKYDQRTSETPPLGSPTNTPAPLTGPTPLTPTAPTAIPTASTAPQTQAPQTVPTTPPPRTQTPRTQTPSPQTSGPQTSTPPAEQTGVQIRISAEQIFTGSPVTLRVVSQDGTTQLTGARWLYGDGANGSGLDVDHTWSAAGTYTVSVTADLTDGGIAATQAVVTVQPSPATLPPTTSAPVPAGTVPGQPASTGPPVVTTPPQTTAPPTTQPPPTTTPPTTPPITTPPPTTPPPTTPPPTTPPPTTQPPAPSSYAETVDHGARTWTNYRTAGGTEGPSIGQGVTVQVSCRVRGYVTPNGNDWWYRIASSPWNNAYYSDADGFYNNGQTSGPSNNVWVDEKVPLC